ncbi:hypothetical protein PCANC_04472 [Puccinia coronata f. sp. avenae]|uniref:Integrase catalytic domain-containing protein n=1 Tax=Puccinia coronata f. sp. avenae TaxID=200324 RepID=A0A2N5VUT1_9BASI|nr:hypothetical protein PCANC_04472 [Puccinia coronata f. sp. avenae]
MKHKLDSFSCFKIFCAHFEKSGSHVIQALRTNNGGEYLSSKLTSYLSASGIKHDPGPPHSPQLNGVAERTKQTIHNFVLSSLLTAHLPKSFWADALFPEPDRKKLDCKARSSILLSYLSKNNSFRLWDLDKRTLVKSRNVIFDKITFPYSSPLKSPPNNLFFKISWPVVNPAVPPSPPSSDLVPLGSNPIPPITPSVKESEPAPPPPSPSSDGDLTFISLPDLPPLPPSPTPSPPPQQASTCQSKPPNRLGH